MTATVPPPADAARDNWVDRLAPAGARPYLRLARMDRPVGTWLLLWPCWWSTALAAGGAGWPDPVLLALFAVGALAMRGAGCTYNDIVDRDIDARVKRTRSRPLPSGQVGVGRAGAFLAAQCLIGLAVLVTFNPFAIALGIAALVPVAVYPFMKRITYWPQAVLGLTFNWGALMGWAAVHGHLGWPAVVLYAGCVFWTLGYDTVYAHQDKTDDAIVGVKSTALKLGRATRAWLAVFYGLFVAALVAAGILAGLGVAFHVGVAAASAHLAWQVARVDIDDPANCLAVFKSNIGFGWIVFAGLIAGQWL